MIHQRKNACDYFMQRTQNQNPLPTARVNAKLFEVKKELERVANTQDYDEKLRGATRVFKLVCASEIIEHIANQKNATHEKFQSMLNAKVIELVRSLQFYDSDSPNTKVSMMGLLSDSPNTKVLMMGLLRQLAEQVRLYHQKGLYLFIGDQYSEVTDAFVSLYDRTTDVTYKNEIYDIMKSHKFPIRRSNRLQK